MRNVFEPSFGNRPERIVGRDDILEIVDRGLASRAGSRDRAMIVIGQRGMGKTALLLEVESRAREAGYVTARTAANESMLDGLIERLQVNGREYVEDGKRKVRGLSAGAFGFSLGLTFSEEVRDNYGFQTKLALLCDRLSDCGKGVLLLVDEVRASSSEMRVLADAYQQLVGDGKNIAICMAGLPSAVSDVLNDRVLTFLNRARKIHLEALPLPSIRSYFAETFERVGLAFADGVLEDAVVATRGFPYLLQLVGYYLIEESGGRTEIDQGTLVRALLDARDDMQDNVFRPTLAELSPKDVEFLVALANASGADGVGGVSAVATAMGKDNGYIQVYRKRLIDAGVLTSPRKGELECVVPFLLESLSGRL